MVKENIPASIGDERYIITCCLNNPDVIIDISNDVSVEDFYVALYRYAFQSCLLLCEKDMRPEPMSVYNHMEKIGVAKPEDLRDLELVSRASYDLANLAEAISGVKSASARRQLIQAQVESIEALTEKSNLSPEDYIGLCEEKILQVSNKLANVTQVYQVGSDALDIVMSRAENPVAVPGLPTGFAPFDEELGGLQDGRLYVVAARYKVGKSIFMVNVAAHLGVDLGIPILIIDTENSSPQTDDRFISLVSGVPEVEIRNGMFGKDPDKVKRVKAAIEKLKNSQIYHHYMPNFTFDNCLSLIRRYKAQKGIKAVIFDYIKAPDPGVDTKQLREDQTIGYLTSNLHNKVAGALKIPVITACQLGRRADGTLDDDSTVADSDRIARYADALIFFREKTADEMERFGYNSRVGTHILSIQVNRSGPAKQNMHDIYFDKPVMKMTEVRARKL